VATGKVGELSENPFTYQCSSLSHTSHRLSHHKGADNKSLGATSLAHR